MGALSFFFGSKQQPQEEYPDEFIIVSYTDVSLEDSPGGDSTKIITRYFLDKTGMRKKEVLRYSEERLQSMIKAYNISFHDKTEEDPKIAVFARIVPGEIKFLRKIE